MDMTPDTENLLFAVKTYIHSVDTVYVAKLKINSQWT